MIRSPSVIWKVKSSVASVSSNTLSSCVRISISCLHSCHWMKHRQKYLQAHVERLVYRIYLSIYQIKSQQSLVAFARLLSRHSYPTEGLNATSSKKKLMSPEETNGELELKQHDLRNCAGLLPGAQTLVLRYFISRTIDRKLNEWMKIASKNSTSKFSSGPLGWEWQDLVCRRWWPSQFIRFSMGLTENRVPLLRTKIRYTPLLTTFSKVVGVNLGLAKVVEVNYGHDNKNR